MRNPYPEKVFPEMDLGEASSILQKAGISPDRVFGNWGREVWNNAYQDILREMGEWLENRPPNASAFEVCLKFREEFLCNKTP